MRIDTAVPALDLSRSAPVDLHRRGVASAPWSPRIPVPSPSCRRCSLASSPSPSILVGGGAGGLIGYAFAELGGFEGALRGLFALGGAVVGAGGVAVVAVLTLRAFGEWQTVREASGSADQDDGRGDVSRSGPLGPRR